MTFPIAYVAGAFPVRSETFVYREVRALRAAGWQVATVSLNEPKERGLSEFADLEAGTVHVYGGGAGATVGSAVAESVRYPLRTMRTLFTALTDAIRPGERMNPAARVKLLAQATAAVGTARRLRKAGVRHVHCHFAHAPTTVGMYAARHLGIPFSFTGHANDLFQRRALLARKLARAAFVACISEWHRELYQRIEPRGPERYHVIRCGVDVNGWTPSTTAARDLSPDQPLSVLTVCRLVEKKGVDTLISGLAPLPRPWRLTVAGDGPERERLKALADKLGCSGSIDWLGAVGNDRVRELLAQADIFALPCREDRSGDRDGIPVVLMEAMACGVPVISGDLPAIRELVRHEQTGLLIDGNRPEQLTAYVAKLLQNSELRGRIAEAARQHVEAEFSLGATIERLTREIQRVATIAPAPQPVISKTRVTSMLN